MTQIKCFKVYLPVLSIHAVAVSVVNVIHLVIFTVFASNMLYTRVPEILKTILSLLREKKFFNANALV